MLSTSNGKMVGSNSTRIDKTFQTIRTHDSYLTCLMVCIKKKKKKKKNRVTLGDRGNNHAEAIYESKAVQLARS